MRKELGMVVSRVFIGATIVAALFLTALPAMASSGSWSDPETLSPVGQTAGSPQVTVDATGLATAIWVADGLIQASTSQSGGPWSEPETLSGANADSPQISVDPTGLVTAVWRRLAAGPIRVIEARQKLPGASDWLEPVNTLSEPGRDSDSPQVKVDVNGLVTAVWISYVEENWQLQTRHKLPNVTDWSSLVGPPASIGLDVRNPKLTVDSNGVATAVWSCSDGDGNQYVQSSKKLDDGAWSSAINLTAPSESKTTYNHDVNTNSNGLVVAVWRRLEGNVFVVQARTSQGLLGAWSEPETLSDLQETSEEPSIIVDQNGLATVAWMRFDVNSNDNVFSSSTYQNGSWSEVENFGIAGSYLYNPKVQFAVDSNGLLTAIWPRWIGGFHVLYSSTSKNGGPWSTPLAVSSVSQGTLEHVLTVDSSGLFTAVWRSDNGEYFRVLSSTFSTAIPAGFAPASTAVLAKTGAEVERLVLATFIAIMAGAGFFALRRRRRTA
jgi:LPXTG-motif cell wall-anchored protein